MIIMFAYFLLCVCETYPSQKYGSRMPTQGFHHVVLHVAAASRSEGKHPIIAYHCHPFPTIVHPIWLLHQGLEAMWLMPVLGVLAIDEALAKIPLVRFPPFPIQNGIPCTKRALIDINLVK